ncbi:terpene synthase family protein [Nocardia sp. NPDC055321]
MNECDLRQLEITLPFPPRPHLSGARAQRHAQHWATRFGLLADERSRRRFESLGYGRFASYWCSGASFADLALLAEWITLFFIFDDLQDAAIAEQRADEYDGLRYRALDVIHRRARPAEPATPVIAALENLCERTYPRQNPSAARRFALNLEIWLMGHARENVFRASSTVPGPAEYPRLRRDACTVLPTVDLAEIAERAVVPDALYFGPAYQEIIATTADLMCWINDLHSLAVETETEDPINLVTVLRRHRGLDLPDAVAQVRAMIADRVRDNLAAAAAIRPEMDELRLTPQVRNAVLRCVRDCQSATAGMELWDRTDTVRFLGTAPARHLSSHC